MTETQAIDATVVYVEQHPDLKDQILDACPATIREQVIAKLNRQSTFDPMTNFETI